MDKSKKVVNYKFKKPSEKTCIEIMSGVNQEDIKQSIHSTEVTVNMPYIGVVWLRGYDSNEPCVNAVKIDAINLPERFPVNVALISGIIIGVIIIIIGGILLFFYLTKKVCFAPDFNFKESMAK